MTKTLNPAAKRIASLVKDCSAHYGSAWYDMSRTQKFNTVAARLFFLVASQAAVEDAKNNLNGTVPATYIANLHTALVEHFAE